MTTDKGESRADEDGGNSDNGCVDGAEESDENACAGWRLPEKGLTSMANTTIVSITARKRRLGERQS